LTQAAWRRHVSSCTSTQRSPESIDSPRRRDARPRSRREPVLGGWCEERRVLRRAGRRPRATGEVQRTKAHGESPPAFVEGNVQNGHG
jgi:hypothetical protein